MEILLFLGTWISLEDISSRGSILEYDLDIIFIVCFMDEESLGVQSSIYCNSYFLGFFFLSTIMYSTLHGIYLFSTILLFFFP